MFQHKNDKIYLKFKNLLNGVSLVQSQAIFNGGIGIFVAAKAAIL